VSIVYTQVARDLRLEDNLVYLKLGSVSRCSDVFFVVCSCCVDDLGLDCCTSTDDVVEHSIKCLQDTHSDNY
jgi:hypothetical protein